MPSRFPCRLLSCVHASIGLFFIFTSSRPARASSLSLFGEHRFNASGGCAGCGGAQLPLRGQGSMEVQHVMLIQNPIRLTDHFGPDHEAVQQSDSVAGLGIRLFLQKLLSDNTTSIAGEVGLTPINSAGTHHAKVQVLDIVALFLFLLLPFVLYLLIQLYDRAVELYWVDPEEDPYLLRTYSGEGKEDMQTPVTRLGSTYNLDPRQQSLQLTSLMTSGLQDSGEGTILQNVLAGFSTAMAALPDAISFSFITGVSPLNGIWAGVFMGLSAALVGGRPGMISSASAATAVVLKDISLTYGLGPMALTVFIVGILQIIAGVLRLSRFITLIPHSVMLGFVNGLAIVMIRAQMRQFHEAGDGPWLHRDLIVSITITALVAMFFAMLWNRVPYGRKVLPAPLASTILTVIFSLCFSSILPRRTLKDVAGAQTFAGGINSMPLWDFPPVGVDWSDRHMLTQILLCAVRFAVVGLLESLMTEALIDQITGTAGSMRRECIGQGVGNVISSFFGTQGGCALIAQSLLNVSSGGVGRVSGVTMGLTLFLSVVVAAKLMGEVPVAVFVGLIVLIALNTFAWGSLELITRINWIDAIVVVTVTAVTVWKDLAIAVLCGVIISGLGFAWTVSTEVRVESYSDADRGTHTFMLHGPLFFGSAMNFQLQISPSSIKEEVVVLDFTESRILDVSGTEAISQVHKSLKERGKHLVLRGVPEDMLQFIEHAGEATIEGATTRATASTLDGSGGSSSAPPPLPPAAQAVLPALRIAPRPQRNEPLAPHGLRQT